MLRLRLLLPSCAIFVLLSLIAGCDGSSSPGGGDWRAAVEHYRTQGDYKSAVIEVKNALKVAPNDADLRLLLGELQLKQRDYTGAEKELTRALSLGASVEKVAPSLVSALFYQRKWQDLIDQIPENAVAEGGRQWVAIELMRAAAHAKLGHAEQAGKAFDRVLEFSPGNAEALLGLGSLALDAGELPKSEGYVDAAIKAAPADPDVWYYMGQIRYRQFRIDDAILSYKRALRRNDAPNRVRIGLAWAYLAKDRVDLARKEALAVRKTNGEHPIANYLLAAIAFKEGDNNKAQEYLNHSLKTAGNIAQSVFLAAANDYALGNYGQAEVHLRDFLKENPDYLPAQTLYAEIQSAQGRSKPAFSGLKAAAERTGREGLVALDLAILALKSGKPNEAKQYLEQVVAAGEKRSEVLEAKAKLEQGFVHRALALLETIGAPVEPDSNAEPSPVDPDRVATIAEAIRAERFEEAEGLARALLVDFPYSVVAHNLLGVALIGMEDFAGARRSFASGADLRPNDPAAIDKVFTLDLSLKDYVAAQRLLDERLEKFPNDVNVLAARARVAMLQGQARESIQWLERILDVDPVSVSTRINMARLYLALKEPKSARSVIQKAYRTHPDNLQVLELMAQGAEAVGDVDQALLYYQRLIEAYPGYSSGYENLAKVQFKAGEPVVAIQTLLSAMEITPGNAEIASLLVRFQLLNGDNSEALKTARKLQQSNHENGEGLLLEGDVLSSQGEYAGAIVAYQKAYEIAPDLGLARALYLAGERSGDTTVGIVALEDWVADNTADARGRVILGNAYRKENRQEAARQQLLAVLANDADNSTALNNLANLESDAGNLQAALKYGKRAYHLSPDNPAIADTLGWLQVRSGNSSDAVAPLEKAARALKSNSEVNYHLAVALADIGRAQDALEHLHAALADGRDFVGRQAARELEKKWRQ